MATKKSTKKKVKKKKEVKEDGIYLERSKSRTQKGQYYLTVWNNGYQILRTSENYHNVKDLLDAMNFATREFLANYFIMNNNKHFHDNTGGK